MFSPKPELEDLLDYSRIPAPPGKRVASVEVIEEDGSEYVRVILEDIPAKPATSLAFTVIPRH